MFENYNVNVSLSPNDNYEYQNNHKCSCSNEHACEAFVVFYRTVFCLIEFFISLLDVINRSSHFIVYDFKLS